jgi:hypothetical protein
MPVEVFRKDIKNLHLGVYPPNGRVRVAAPLRIDEDAVRLAVISRLGWIRRKQAEFEQQHRQSQREFVTGESHYFEGRRYRLDVTEHSGPSTVRLLNNTRIALTIRPGTDRDKRETIMNDWYRRQLQTRLPKLVDKWESKVGEHIAEVRIRKMKTCWGTCNQDARRIWLNLELAKKPVSCLEYILVHEMVHLIERCHNDHFRDLMNEYMPQWRLHRDVLNRAPLAHAEWRY